MTKSVSLVVILRFRGAGIIKQPAENNIDKQGPYHAEIAGEYGPIPLDAVFSEVAESGNRRKEQQKRRDMLPVEAVGGNRADVIVEKDVQQEDQSYNLRNADEGGIGIELVQKSEVHQRLIRSQRVRHNFYGRIGEQKHLPYVAGAAAGIVHLCRPVLIEEIKQCKEGNQHQQKFQEKDCRPVGNIPRRIRHRDTEGQALQKFDRGDRALADKTAVKQCTEPDESNQ